MRDVRGRKTDSSFICGVRGSGEIPVLLLLLYLGNFACCSHIARALHLAVGEAVMSPCPPRAI